MAGRKIVMVSFRLPSLAGQRNSAIVGGGILAGFAGRRRLGRACGPRQAIVTHIALLGFVARQRHVAFALRHGQIVADFTLNQARQLLIAWNRQVHAVVQPQLAHVAGQVGAKIDIGAGRVDERVPAVDVLRPAQADPLDEHGVQHLRGITGVLAAHRRQSQPVDCRLAVTQRLQKRIDAAQVVLLPSRSAELQPLLGTPDRDAIIGAEHHHGDLEFVGRGSGVDSFVPLVGVVAGKA